MEVAIRNAVWYLGIDFGSTGISATLLNRSTAEQYPIYWSNELPMVNPQSATYRSGEGVFRLPAMTYSGSACRDISPEQLYYVQMPAAPIVVGSLASTLADKQPGIFLENFKPYLNLGIPYYCPRHYGWEPTVQLPNQQQVSLYWVRRTLQALFATLLPKGDSVDAAMKADAVGLESEMLRDVLPQLEGVVLGTPAAWSDTYRLNLREAVLESGLVRHAEQIFFLEDVIAPILASLHTQSKDSSKHQSPKGGTLVINAGATTTEIALVDLPDNPKDLTYSDFTLCSLPYAGHFIDQDIVCQLLYPQLSEPQRQQLLQESDFELPLPGQPDLEKRDRLNVLLQNSPLGQALLKAAGYLKVILQHKEEFTLNIGNSQWSVKRLDLENLVVLPFTQQIGSELNKLLLKTGISEYGVYQAFCVGGTGVLAALQTWVRQRLPLATLIQDSDSSTGNWVAAGLASLPLYPQVLNRLQQQYSDYFLLSELLRAFSEPALDSGEYFYTLEEIMQQLERQGLNTGACYQRIVRLVEGQLPPGLVPSIENASWLAPASKQDLLYSADPTNTGIFEREEEQLYYPNFRQQKRLRQYLDIVLSGIHQKFEEPLIVKLGVADSSI